MTKTTLKKYANLYSKRLYVTVKEGFTMGVINQVSIHALDDCFVIEASDGYRPINFKYVTNIFEAKDQFKAMIKKYS